MSASQFIFSCVPTTMATITRITATARSATKSFREKLSTSFAISLLAAAVIGNNAAGDPIPEGPPGDIGTLTEEDFIVDGSAGGAKRFTFTNGERSLYFIPMIHIAEQPFYDRIAAEVERLKLNGADLYYEFIDFDTASVADKLRIRAMLGMLPSPAFYAENVSDGLVAQDYEAFLGFPGGQDVNVDLTPAQIADAYEMLIGPLEISEENLSTPMRDFVLPTADPARVTQITIDARNRHLAAVIDAAPGNVVVLYGAAHGAGTLQELRALDPEWRRAPTF